MWTLCGSVALRVGCSGCFLVVVGATSQQCSSVLLCSPALKVRAVG